jgi:hypothetical protein
LGNSGGAPKPKGKMKVEFWKLPSGKFGFTVPGETDAITCKTKEKLTKVASEFLPDGETLELVEVTVAPRSTQSPDEVPKKLVELERRVEGLEVDSNGFRAALTKPPEPEPPKRKGLFFNE